MLSCLLKSEVFQQAASAVYDDKYPIFSRIHSGKLHSRSVRQGWRACLNCMEQIQAMRSGYTAIFNDAKSLKMGAIRKPRFSDCVVEKAMDGFFNNLLDCHDEQ